uniref:Uncharacterized protein n=1 Tax=Amphimedon queenslandica TaxID=400682 RepID=A0A1X7SWN6_AMPQE
CGEVVLANFTLNTVTDSLLYDPHLISEDQCSFTTNNNYSLLFLNPKKLTIKNCHFTSSNDTHAIFNGALIKLFNTKGTASFFIDKVIFSNFREAFKVLLDKSFYNTLNIENTEFINNRIGFGIIAINSNNNSISVIASQFNGNKYQGLKIFYNKSCSNNFMIFGCAFSNNTGCNGVSIDLALAINSTSNIFLGIGSRFINNSAKYAGGGVIIDLSPAEGYQYGYPSNNTIIFQFCDFNNNSGSYAGGVGIFNYNQASSGSAVHINRNIPSESGSYFVALIFFYNCNFLGNGQYHFNSRASGSKVLQSGAFYANKVWVNFVGKTQFTNNNSTALQASDTNIEFKDNSKTIFQSNSGIKGGAILLTGDSELYVKYNTSIIFNGNRAVSYGGAIAVLHLQCFGTFDFSARSIATPTKSLSVSQVINAIPGIPMKLNIIARDIFENDTSALFPLTLTLSGTNSIRMNPNVITSNIHVSFYGNPHETAQLLIQTDTITSITVTAKLKLVECPPGFIFNKTGFCFCSALINSHYQAITANYWDGYLNISNASDGTFVTGHCSVKLCNYNNTKHKFGFYQLPIDYDKEKLNDFVCSSNRTGTLCTKCIKNHIVSYHSPSFKCEPSH